MKNSFLARSRFIVSAAVALCVLTGATALAQSQTNKLRVGVYDSRATAIAYGNSAAFQDSLKPVQAEYEKAKAAKDDKRMKEIDAQMKLRQRRLHEQGFSTGSVAYIMAKAPVKAALPDVEVVDVTDELTALFHPNEKVLGWLKDMKNHPPLPIEEITDDMD